MTWLVMSIRQLVLPENAWLAADRREQIKNAAFILAFAGIALAGMICLAWGLIG
jgi:hypothetical protein